MNLLIIKLFMVIILKYKQQIHFSILGDNIQFKKLACTSIIEICWNIIFKVIDLNDIPNSIIFS